MLHLIQLRHRELGRRVALVKGNELRLLRDFTSVYDLAMSVIEQGQRLAATAEAQAGDQTFEYDPIYLGQSPWQILPCLDHPNEPACCMLSGTGLTHKASAASRQVMHEQASGADEPAEDATQITDSMRMFQWGLEGGRPEPGKIGTAPEWFYKGTGLILRGHGEPLRVPAHADDGGEEPEVCGLYLIDADGKPRRLGMAIGNEFADHVQEKKNYLYLAPSKLRTASVGPELVVDPDFNDVTGTVRIVRGQREIWSKEIRSGQANMSHTLENLEHHHFKYDAHRRPGDVHVHYYGADAFSFGSGVKLDDGDVMEVAWEGFGRPLRNPIRIDPGEQKLVRVEPL